MQTINSFRGEYYFLSNFYPCKVTVPVDRMKPDGEKITFANAEAAFHAYKCEGDAEAMRASANLPPNEAKRLGRRVDLDVAAWNGKRIDCMRTVVRAKFTQNRDLRHKLAATDKAMLIEGNTWGDAFWGVSNGGGENRLGQLLTETRRLIMQGQL